jgi:hypothetical protein
LDNWSEESVDRESVAGAASGLHDDRLADCEQLLTAIARVMGKS